MSMIARTMCGMLLLATCSVPSQLVQAAQASSMEGLQNARAGLVACLRPDTARRRCNTLTLYQFKTADSIDILSDVTMSAAPPIVMSTIFRAIVKGDAICIQQSTAEDVAHSTFTIAGNTASEGETRDIRAQIVRNLQAQGPGENCVTFEHQGEWFARVVFGGVRRPDMDEPVIWLPAGHMYSAGP
jgi:hypothetical protein